MLLTFSKLRHASFLSSTEMSSLFCFLSIFKLGRRGRLEPINMSKLREASHTNKNCQIRKSTTTHRAATHMRAPLSTSVYCTYTYMYLNMYSCISNRINLSIKLQHHSVIRIPMNWNGNTIG